MRKITRIVVLGCTLVAFGCAPRPENIEPTYVATVNYEAWSCVQLGQEEQKIDAAYTTAARRERHAWKADTVDVLLLGLPLASMTGDDIAPLVASLRGQQVAIRQVETEKHCGAGASATPTPPLLPPTTGVAPTAPITSQRTCTQAEETQKQIAIKNGYTMIPNCQ
jgi:hypothetical protein